jgi:hypothetical protein
MYSTFEQIYVFSTREGLGEMAIIFLVIERLIKRAHAI